LSFDGDGALAAARQGLAYAAEHRMPYSEALVARKAAALEAAHGTARDTLALFDTTVDSCHRAGNIPWLATTLTSLAVLFDRIDQPEIAATVYGTSIRYGVAAAVLDFDDTVEHLRTVLGDVAFDQCVAAGSAMELAAAVRYARHEIQEVRRQIGAVG
jgi:hypothetical protein